MDDKEAWHNNVFIEWLRRQIRHISSYQDQSRSRHIPSRKPLNKTLETVQTNRATSLYRDAGYDFIMLSDHFLPEFEFPITDTRNYRTHEFTTILGAEIHAPATGHGDLWHILAAGLPLDFKATASDESGPGLARRAAEAGAFVGIAHPAWNGLSVEDARSIDAAHGVEIFNYGCALETDRGDGFYVLDAFLNENRRLSGFATDDAHFHARDHGHAWVMVKSTTNEPEYLITALKQGDYYTSGIGLLFMRIYVTC